MAKKVKTKFVPNEEKNGVITMDLPEMIKVTKVRDIKQTGTIVDADNNRFSITDLIYENEKLVAFELSNGDKKQIVSTFQLNAIVRRKGNAIREDTRDLIVSYE